MKIYISFGSKWHILNGDKTLCNISIKDRTFETSTSETNVCKNCGRKNGS